MINFSKTTLFILMFTMSTLAGVTLSIVNWEALEAAQGIRAIYKEIQFPVLFFGLSVLFMIPYVKKIKEEKKSIYEDK